MIALLFRQLKHYILELSTFFENHSFAKFFEFEISCLADKFLMEAEEDVKSGRENGGLQRR
ncbi:MAG: hypothetical protein AMK69_02810 [Nitrospira bacterium SG8_3]|nr:MAG: hypothetical protein AMK69_02810 [Nitrospira bacterium SG8_3]